MLVGDVYGMRCWREEGNTWDKREGEYIRVVYLPRLGAFYLL